MVKAKGQRLSGFCDAMGIAQGAFRSLLQTGSLPFETDDAPVVEGRESGRRRYDGGDYFAMYLAVTLSGIYGVPLKRVSEWVRDSGCAKYFLAALGRGDEVREAAFVYIVRYDPKGLGKNFPLARYFETAASLENYIHNLRHGDKDQYVTHLTLDLKPAYDCAVEQARSQGFLLASFEIAPHCR